MSEREHSSPDEARAGQHSSAGPLTGLRVLEFAGMGPGPFGAMLLRDMGADLVCIGRPGSVSAQESVASRGNRCVELDLKTAEGRDAAFSLIDAADVLIEGYRPGVMDRFGLGPNSRRVAIPVSSTHV